MSQSRKTSHVFGSLDILNYESVNNRRITNVGNPILDNDATNKSYVDNIIVMNDLHSGIGITLNTVGNTININDNQPTINGLGIINAGIWNSDPIQIPYGGTGQTRFTPNTLVYYAGTNSLISTTQITFDTNTFNIDVPVIITDTTDSNSNGGGSLNISGGAFISKNLVVNGDTNIIGNITVGNITVNSNISLNSISSDNGTFTNSSIGTLNSLYINTSNFDSVNIRTFIISTGSLLVNNLQCNSSTFSNSIFTHLTSSSLNVPGITILSTTNSNNISTGALNVVNGKCIDFVTINLSCGSFRVTSTANLQNSITNNATISNLKVINTNSNLINVISMTCTIGNLINSVTINSTITNCVLTNNLSTNISSANVNISNVLNSLLISTGNLYVKSTIQTQSINSSNIINTNSTITNCLISSSSIGNIIVSGNINVIQNTLLNSLIVNQNTILNNTNITNLTINNSTITGQLYASGISNFNMLNSNRISTSNILSNNNTTDNLHSINITTGTLNSTIVISPNTILTNITNTNLINTNLINTNLININITNTNLINTNLINTNITTTNINSINNTFSNLVLTNQLYVNTSSIANSYVVNSSVKNINAISSTISNLIIDNILQLNKNINLTSNYSGVNNSVGAFLNINNSQFTNTNSTTNTIGFWYANYIATPTLLATTSQITNKTSNVYIQSNVNPGINQVINYNSALSLGYVSNTIGGSLNTQLTFERSDGNPYSGIYTENTSNRLVIINSSLSGGGGLGMYTINNTPITFSNIPNSTNITPIPYIQFLSTTTQFLSSVESNSMTSGSIVLIGGLGVSKTINCNNLTVTGSINSSNYGLFSLSTSNTFYTGINNIIFDTNFNSRITIINEIITFIDSGVYSLNLTLNGNTTTNTNTLIQINLQDTTNTIYQTTSLNTTWDNYTQIFGHFIIQSQSNQQFKFTLNNGFNDIFLFNNTQQYSRLIIHKIG